LAGKLLFNLLTARYKTAAISAYPPTGDRSAAFVTALMCLKAELLEADCVAGKEIDVNLFGQLSDRIGRAFDGSSEQLIELLAERQLDAVLTMLDDRVAKFPSRALFKEPYVLAVPQDHRFAQRKSVMPADLRDEPFIIRTDREKFKDASEALISHGTNLRGVAASRRSVDY
jgi:LysR substrate binding domain